MTIYYGLFLFKLITSLDRTIKKGILIENKEFHTKFLSSLNKYNDQNEFGVRPYKPQIKLDYPHQQSKSINEINKNVRMEAKAPFKKIRDPILEGEILRSTTPKRVVKYFSIILIFT